MKTDTALHPRVKPIAARRVASASAAAGPLRPEVREARGLRYEQDAAYEESLAADRAKAQAAEAAARAAEEAARKEREESEVCLLFAGPAAGLLLVHVCVGFWENVCGPASWRRC